MSALQATAMANVQGCQEHLNVTGGHRSVAGVAAMAIQILIGFSSESEEEHRQILEVFSRDFRIYWDSKYCIAINVMIKSFNFKLNLNTVFLSLS